MIDLALVDGGSAQAETVVRRLKLETLQGAGEGGFYHNRSIIRQAARSSELKCLRSGRSIAGYAVFTIGQGRSKIDILEIFPDHRGRGLGRYLAEHVIRMLFLHGPPRVELECAPRSSEAFWRRLGFVDVEGAADCRGNPRLTLRASDFVPISAVRADGA